MNVILLGVGGLFVYKKGGLSYLVSRAAPTALDSSYFRERRSVFESMPQHEGAIVFIGDSHTERCPWNELLRRPDVLNRGIGGDTLPGVRQRVSEALRHHPRQLFVMAGINDLITNDATTKQLAQQFRSLVAAVKKSSPRTQLVLQSVLPVNKKNFASRPPDLADKLQKSMNNDIREVNQSLKAMADGKQVIYIDIHSHLLDAAKQLDIRYTFDGLHLNGKGYSKWKQLLLPLINRQLVQQAR